MSLFSHAYITVNVSLCLQEDYDECLFSAMSTSL